MAPTPPRLIRFAIVLAGVLAAVFLLRAATGLGGARAERFFSTWVYDAAELLAVVALLARSRIGERDRAPWGLIGAGLALDLTGDLLWNRIYGDGSAAPAVSVCDVFYLASYVPMIAAGVLFARSTMQRARSGLWIDGLVGALAGATVFAALVVKPVVAALGGGQGRIGLAVQVAYPIADLLLVAVFIAACALGGWRMTRRWTVFCAGAVAYVVADSLYLLESLHDSYVSGRLLDAGWLVPSVAWAAVAWNDRGDAGPAGEEEPPRRATFLAAAGFGIAASVVCFREALLPDSDPLTLALGLATSLAVFARFAATSADNLRLLAATRDDAATDPLTGLANRRRLMAELARLDGAPRMLALFDLNGFKTYNDTFGHPAGDRLLVTIAGALTAAVGDTGTAFRLGGDEFCVLARATEEAADAVACRLADELAQSGPGFAITASYGCVTLPVEASTPEDALRIADHRLYADKRGGRLRPAA